MPYLRQSKFWSVNMFLWFWDWDYLNKKEEEHTEQKLTYSQNNESII